MEPRRAAAVAVLVALVLSGCTAGYRPAADAPPTATPPSGDLAGYYGGYWYNDTFELEPARGLSDAELEAVVARAMARIQRLRGLRFERRVTVELVSRETFRAEYGGVTVPDVDADTRALENAAFEALFLVGPTRDVFAVRRENRGENVIGLYQPGAKRIVLVSDSSPPTLSSEGTLVHELVHALQDQRLSIGHLGANTTDGRLAVTALVEGDALRVERRYERRCATGTWDCVETTDTGGRSSLGPGFHYGVYYVSFFPYAEGPRFVEHHRRERGFDAVDAMYDDPPATSAAIVHPRTYDSPPATTATLTDRSGDAWAPVGPPGESLSDSVGQAGLVAMFAYTLADDRHLDRAVIEPASFYNRNAAGRLNESRPFTYDVAYADGWAGDRLWAYERTDATGGKAGADVTDGESAYLWNVTFVDRANATEFARGYRRVLAYWGGERRQGPGDATVWTFGDDGRFRGALRVRVNGRSVTVVKAPSVRTLSAVSAPVATRSRAGTVEPARGDT